MATDVNNVNELDDNAPHDALKPSENGTGGGSPVQPVSSGSFARAGRSEVLMSVQQLQKYFPVRGGVMQRVVGQVKAVDGVNFDVYRGETLGLVGESGCGKTTVGRTVLRLLNPTGGKVVFEGRDIMSLNASELKKARRNMQIVFQDPYSSLDPRVPIGQSVGEGLLIHGVSKDEREQTVRDMLKRVGLHPEHSRRYPHEFSGGQRQRIGIARALTMHPQFIVADEPVSALDVSIQSQVLNLLKELQREFNLTYLFIAHNLSVVEHISDRVGVMYLGKMAELADRDELFNNPRHPYTQALLSAIPIPDPRIRRERIILKGDVPSPLNPPSGCRFHTRCWLAQQICTDQEPEWRDIGSENLSGHPHLVACHFAEQTKVKGLADEIREQLGVDAKV